MEAHQQSWDKYYKEQTGHTHDIWLEKYSNYFLDRKEKKILDLGCGNGSNLPFLLQHSKYVYALDYSNEAIKQVRKKYQVNACVADLRNELPYSDRVFDIVISDLSLHYFSTSDTVKIIKEIHRIMKTESIFLARVNSSNDINHGATEGNEIEPYYREIDGNYKRFFNGESIKAFFEPCFYIEGLREMKTGKYSREKVVWEIKGIKG